MSICKFICEAPCTARRHAIFWLVLPFLCVVLFQPKASAMQAGSPSPARQQDVIGRLYGDDVSVTGAVGFEQENGRTTALLASGSDLTLRSGQARIDLPEGGDIILCGPAHLSILKSGPAITIALDYGQVHLQVGATTHITIYSPLFVVTPQPIGDRQRDLTAGLDQNGELCVMALSGAMRVEEQLTGESVIIPQGGDVEIDGGDLRTLRSGGRKCSCELLVSGNNMPKQVEASAPAHPSPNVSIAARAPESTSSATYRIEMPLTFDASSAIGSALTSEAIRVIRESVAQPPISFRGVVRPALPPPPAEVFRSNSRSRHSRPSLLARFFGIFRHRRPSASQQSAAAQL
jgi:hypothetical protein